MIICQDRLETNIRKMLIKLPPAHTHTWFSQTDQPLLHLAVSSITSHSDSDSDSYSVQV